jgi:hypothetical protein
MYSLGIEKDYIIMVEIISILLFQFLYNMVVLLGCLVYRLPYFLNKNIVNYKTFINNSNIYLYV